jgi:hypothetical protein
MSDSRLALSHAMQDRLLTMMEYLAGITGKPPELTGTDAELRLTWLLYCVVKNGWDAPVPPFPGDVPKKYEREKAEMGLALDDPMPQVSIHAGRDDTQAVP